jgi:RNA polymerase sigma-70 factor (ECF subfamily)
MSPRVSLTDAASFHTVRPRLFGIACRVLGSANEADDVVQDAWIRWQGTDRSQVRDAGAFLAATTTRLAINVGQSARARRETCIEAGPLAAVDAGADPSLGAVQREALELALRTLLEKLSATERAAYILREAFDYPYRRIGEILALSEANARQLVTRARRRLAGEAVRAAGADEHRRLLVAFTAAAQTGDIAPLERLLAGCAPAERSVLRVAA